MNERTSALLILLLLCATLTTWFFSAVELRNLEDELSRLEAERDQLRVQYFREREANCKANQELRQKIQEFLDLWGVDEAEATFYTKECGTGDGITFTGTEATVGRTVAVDPAVIPLGSWLYIQGIGWRRAEDTGKAVKGLIVDVYIGEGKKARYEALRAGRREVKILYREARA